MNDNPSHERPRRDDLSAPSDAPLDERSRRYRTLFGAMDEGFCVVEMVLDDVGKPVDYRFLEFNDAFERMTGITAEAALAGKSAKELYPTLEDHWFETYGRVAATGQSVRFENRAEAMGKWFEVHAFRIEGREVGILFKDVTERKRVEAERERLLFEAREREAFLRLVTDRLPVRVGYLDREYRYLFMNGAYERAFGVPPGKGAGLTVTDLAGEGAFRIAKPYLDRALAGDTHTQEFDVPYPFGNRRVEVQYVADRDESGEVRGLVIHVVDVTERHAMTEALRKREERYRTLFDALEEGFCVIEMIFDEAGKPVDYRFKEINATFTAQTGLRREDALAGKTIREMVPGHEQLWYDRYGGVALTGDSATFEERAEALGRDYAVHAFRIGGGESREVGVLFKDVTQERAAQRAVEEQRARQDRTLENAEVATFDWDVPNDRVHANPLLARFFGISEPDAHGGPIATYFAAVHPDDRDRIVASIQTALDTGSRYETEYRVTDAEGRERSVLARGDATLGPDGKPLRLSGVVLDITAREQTAQALRERDARLREAYDLLESITEGTRELIVSLDCDYRFTSLNEAYRRDFVKVFGVEPQVGASLLETLAHLPEDRDNAKALWGRALAGESIDLTAAFGDPGLARRVFDLRFYPVRNAEGGIVGAAEIARDVTDRAEAEAERERLLGELEVEKGRLEALFRLSPSAIAVIRGDDLRFEFANDAYNTIVGRKDVVGMTLFEALPEIEGQGFDALLRDVMATGQPYFASEAPVQIRLQEDKEPVTIYVDLLYQAIREADGTVSGVFVHAVDMTVQVRARKAISEREELFRTVFEQAPDDAIIVTDADRIVTAWNPSAERITRWSAEEAIGGSADLIFTPEERAKGVPDEEAATAAREGKAEDERWHVRKDGARFWASGTMNSLHSDDGGVRGYLKVFRDATARYEETETLAFLSRFTEAVVRQRDAGDVILTCERMLGEHLGVSRVAFAEADAEGAEVTVEVDWSPGLPSLVGSHRVADFGPAVEEDFRLGRTHVSRDAEREYAPGAGLEAIRAIGARSGLSVPIRKENRLAGLLVVHHDEPRDWTEGEVALARQVADRMLTETERAHAEAALRASEERFRAAQETTPEAFTIIEAVRNEGGEIVDFRYVYANPAARRTIMQGVELGASVRARRESMQGTELFRAYVRTVETGAPFNHEMPLEFGGNRRYMRLTVSKVGDGAATALTDITERYVEAQTLAFLSLLTDAVIDERDPDRIIATVERMLGQYLGASRVTFGEFAEDEETFTVRSEWGPDVASVVGTWKLSSFGEAAVESLRAGRNYVSRDVEAELDGSALEAIRAIRALAGITIPVLKDGRLAALVVAHQAEPRDWTADEIDLVKQVADRLAAEIERARAETALRTSEERFRQLVELSPVTVWFAEPDGGLSYISHDFYDATGLTPELALPHGWTSVVHPDDLGVVAADWEAARRDGTLYDTEFRIRHRDGVYRWISARALPVRNAAGEVTGWLGSNSDIQERKSLEETLQASVDEATKELQNAVKEAEGFNYSISHDLRAPLRAMSSTAGILLEEAGPELSEEHREMLVRQAENAHRLGRLIDELLRLSRLARVEVRRQPLDMTQKVRSVAAELAESGLDNGCRIVAQEGMVAEGDPGLVRTVYHNLIGNACKFSPPGAAVWAGETSGTFWVRDEGVGFDMQFAGKVFLPFERLVSETEFPGTGIGLANVKRIVERHKGKVWVESAPGKGTTFYFTLA